MVSLEVRVSDPLRFHRLINPFFELEDYTLSTQTVLVGHSAYSPEDLKKPKGAPWRRRRARVNTLVLSTQDGPWSQATWVKILSLSSHISLGKWLYLCEAHVLISPVGTR